MTGQIDTTKHPLPLEPAAWYAGRDEEVLPIGPCDSREQVISEAISSEVWSENDDGTCVIFIGKYVKQRVNLSKYFDAEDFLERTSERMDDNGDGSNEDGDHHPINEISGADTADLEIAVREAIWKWQRDKGLQLKCWWMDSVGGEEVVTVPLPAEQPHA